MKIKNLILKIVSVALVIATLLGISVSSFAVRDSIFANNAVQSTESADEETEKKPRNEAIVDVARAKIGFYPSNINEFTTWYYGRETDAYWCSIFVSWCADQVGALGTAVPKRSSVDAMRQWFINKDQYYPATSDYVPQKGDILFINTECDGTDDVHHVDIITEDGFRKSRGTKYVKCIGGNTSDINYNGSEYVTEKSRPVNSSRAIVIGYAHPDYASSEGLLGSLYTLADDLSPAFVTYLYSKIISFLPKLSIFFQLINILLTYDYSTPAEPAV